jgi:hypothetical protein
MVYVDMDVEENVWINGTMTLINIFNDKQRCNKGDMLLCMRMLLQQQVKLATITHNERHW